MTISTLARGLERTRTDIMTTRRDDSVYPIIKIYDLSSLLATITTDYAGHALVHLGATDQQIAILNRVVRPWIKRYEFDFYGIVASELVRLQRELVAELRRNNDDANSLYRLMLELSDGGRRMTWVPQLAWGDLQFELDDNCDGLGLDDGRTRHLPRAFIELYSAVVRRPEKQLEAIYGPLNAVWRSSERSHELSAWDRLFQRFFQKDMEPSVSHNVMNKLIRDFAVATVREFSELDRKSIHSELIQILKREPRMGLRASSIDASFLSFTEIVSRTEAEWVDIQKDLRTNFQ